MDKLMKTEINRIKKRQKTFLGNQGKILFLYLDGIMTQENINLSEQLIKDGLGYYINKEWSEINYFIENDDLNRMFIKTQSGGKLLKDALGMHRSAVFETNEKDEEEILSYLKEGKNNVIIKGIKKVREYDWKN